MFKTEAFKAYLQDTRIAENTLEAYCGDLHRFVAYCRQAGLESPREIDEEVLERYFSQLLAAGRSPATVRRVRSCLNRYFSFLQKEGVLGENPLRAIPAGQPKKEAIPEILSSEEIDRLLSCDYGANEKALRDKAILELLYATGIRIGSLITLCVDDYDPARKTIQVEGRRIPLYRSADQSLRQYLLQVRPYIALPNEKALFVNLQGKSMSRQGLWKMLRQRAEDAGIQKDLTPRLLRRSFAVHLAENGAEAEDLEKLLGLKDKASAAGYVKMAKDGDMADSYNRFHPRAGKKR